MRAGHMDVSLLLKTDYCEANEKKVKYFPENSTCLSLASQNQQLLKDFDQKFSFSS